MSKEAFELKKWSSEIISKYPSSTVGADDLRDEWYGVENGVDVLYLALLVKRALAELAKQPGPICKPCGEEAIKEAMEAVEQRKQGRYKLVYDKSSRTIIAVPNPNYCPDCKQPEPGEFTKEVRQNYYENGVCGKIIYKLCAHIDRQAAELKELKAEKAKRSTNLDTQKVHEEIMEKGLRNGIEQAELLTKLKAQAEEIERLKKALAVIARPVIKGSVFTLQKYEADEHQKRMLEYLNKRQPEGTKILSGNFYQLAASIAEGALKGEKAVDSENEPTVK